MKRSIFISILLLLALLPPGCERAPAGHLQTTQMTVGDRLFTLEIAIKAPDQELGLMHRDHLDADRGMIFVFPNSSVQTFWNHDVSFPLDLIFLDSAGSIVSIKRLETYSDKAVSSDVPASFAIELNAGIAAQLRLQPGDHLRIPPQAMPAGSHGQ